MESNKLRGQKVQSYFIFVDTRDQAEAFHQEYDTRRKESIKSSGVTASR